MSVVGLWDRHPLLANAVRMAVAAPLAWLLIQWLPSPVGDYHYYAPMGAVIATSANPGGSLKTGAQAAAAITLGGLAAILADLVGEPDNALPMAVAVLIAALLTGLSWLGSMASWVPTAAVFTLLIGGGDIRYVAIYTGILVAGAVVATLVTLATPSQPLLQAHKRMDDLRDALSTQLDDLIRDLETEQTPSQDGTPSARLSQAQAAISRTHDATNANPRVRRHRGEIAQAEVQLLVYGHLVEALSLIARAPARHAGEPSPLVRAATVQALRSLRALVATRSLGQGSSEEQAQDTALDDLHRAWTTLDQTLGGHPVQHGLLPAGVLITVAGTHQVLATARDRARDNSRNT